MRIGDLDDQIELYSYAATNDSGEVVDVYTLVASVWAYVKTESGSEAFQSARTNATRLIRVKIRYRDDVTTKWRIEWLGESYEIITVDRSMRRSGELWVTARGVEIL